MKPTRAYPPPVLVWFRSDLRLEDNPALAWAAARGAPVAGVFIWGPEEEAGWAPGAAARWWLRRSLQVLADAIERTGSRLIVRTGPALQCLPELVRQTGAAAVAWNRRYEPALIRRDRRVEDALRSAGTAVDTFTGSLLFEPHEIRNAAGEPFRVFTPFWKTCLARLQPPAPQPAPKSLVPLALWPAAPPPAALELGPAHDRSHDFGAHWDPGEAGARRQLRRFVERGLAGYAHDRDRPDREGTSRLSPHLHFGEIGPRQIWHALERALARRGGRIASGTQAFLRQIGWREFAWHLLFHFPRTPEAPLRAAFERFPWETGAAAREALAAWRGGRTGYPIVDAGMRQLCATGWMHNRVRMIAASFLVKDLLLPWQQGARWFWDTLVDADLANNTLGWQWTAGCGADATPYFRVFNPAVQGERFDPHGDYVRRWVPELGAVPARWIHRPWLAPDEVLKRAGVELGRDYPMPMVDHAEARRRALEVFRKWGRSPVSTRSAPG